MAYTFEEDTFLSRATSYFHFTQTFVLWQTFAIVCLKKNYFVSKFKMKQSIKKFLPYFIAHFVIYLTSFLLSMSWIHIFKKLIGRESLLMSSLLSILIWIIFATIDLLMFTGVLLAFHFFSMVCCGCNGLFDMNLISLTNSMFWFFWFLVDTVFFSSAGPYLIVSSNI